ncbi:5976_t:CDS:2, partial [Cetraspora pellucida]
MWMNFFALKDISLFVGYLTKTDLKDLTVQWERREVLLAKSLLTSHFHLN